MLINDLNQGTYDVRVKIGPSYATRRAEAADAMLQFIQVVPQAASVAGDLVARNMDWPGADEIADRLKRMLPPQITGEAPPLGVQIAAGPEPSLPGRACAGQFGPGAGACPEVPGRSGTGACPGAGRGGADAFHRCGHRLWRTARPYANRAAGGGAARAPGKRRESRGRASGQSFRQRGETRAAIRSLHLTSSEWRLSNADWVDERGGGSKVG